MENKSHLLVKIINGCSQLTTLSIRSGLSLTRSVILDTKLCNLLVLHIYCEELLTDHCMLHLASICSQLIEFRARLNCDQSGDMFTQLIINNSQLEIIEITSRFDEPDATMDDPIIVQYDDELFQAIIDHCPMIRTLYINGFCAEVSYLVIADLLFKCKYLTSLHIIIEEDYELSPEDSGEFVSCICESGDNYCFLSIRSPSAPTDFVTLLISNLEVTHLRLHCGMSDALAKLISNVLKHSLQQLDVQSFEYAIGVHCSVESIVNMMKNCVSLTSFASIVANTVTFTDCLSILQSSVSLLELDLRYGCHFDVNYNMLGFRKDIWVGGTEHHETTAIITKLLEERQNLKSRLFATGFVNKIQPQQQLNSYYHKWDDEFFESGFDDTDDEDSEDKSKYYWNE